KMQVSDFITEVGDMLQEDFTYAPLWTKAELIKYLKVVLREFSFRTMLYDKDSIRLVNATTGEADMPSDFITAYYARFHNAMVDIVQLPELEYASPTWMLNTTGTSPQAATVFGSGDNAVMRFVPVPSVVSGAFASNIIYPLTLADAGGVVWTVSTFNGALETTVGGASGLSIVLAGPTTYWDLGVSVAGVLTTTASASTAGQTVYALDTGTNAVVYSLRVSDTGVLNTQSLSYGITVGLFVDDTLQNFFAGDNSTNADYGVLVDLYATGVSTTPTSVGRASRPTGDLIYSRTSDHSAHVVYKARIPDISTINDELYVCSAMIPFLKYGVLALALSKEGDGQDLKRAAVFRSAFMGGCDSLKRFFGRR
ncbi:MAG: hypothetical protein KKD77_24020, partial [Gammaproteobacteria bacterium]|nr:hypothetical protein [Gammaproteobacteria bacterium]